MGPGGNHSPGNRAVGGCHHPPGPHQKAPTEVLPVHLDGGDEGPRVRHRCLSPDDPTAVSTWWVRVVVNRGGGGGLDTQHRPRVQRPPALLPALPAVAFPSPAGPSAEPPRLRMSRAASMLVQRGPPPPPVGPPEDGGGLNNPAGRCCGHSCCTDTGGYPPASSSQYCCLVQSFWMEICNAEG